MKRFLQALFSVCPLIAVTILLLVADIASACGPLAARRAAIVNARAERCNARAERCNARAGNCAVAVAVADDRPFRAVYSTEALAAPQAMAKAETPTQYVDKDWLAKHYPSILKEAEADHAVKEMPRTAVVSQPATTFYYSNGACVGPNCQPWR